MEEKNKNEIDIKTILGVLKLRWPFMVVAAVLLAVIVFTVMSFQTPMYSSRSLYFIDNYTMYTDISGSQIDAASSLAKQYCVVVGTNDYYDRVAEKLNESGTEQYTRAKVKSMLTATTSEKETGFFRMVATSPDPDEAYKLILACEEITPAYIAEQTNFNPDPENPASEKVKISEKGELAKNPDATRKNLYTAVAGIAGFAITYVIFFIVELCNVKIYNEDDIKDRYSKPVLGVIPEWNIPGQKSEKKKRRNKSREKGYYGYYTNSKSLSKNYNGKIISEGTPFAIVESFNMLRTNLTFIGHGEACPVLGITSAYSNTGKTVVMSNIAVSFAQLGKRVLLVDADLRCPSVASVFKIESQSGLSEYLAGIDKTAARSTMTDLGYSKFDVITSGKIPPNPAELLSSEAMKKFIEEEKQNYDIILIDMPPICEVTDASVMSGSLTAYVCAVLSGYSDQYSVHRMVNILQGVNANVAGFVVNGVNIKTRGGSGSRYSRSYSAYSRKNTYGYANYSKYSKYSNYSQAKAADDASNNISAK